MVKVVLGISVRKPLMSSGKSDFIGMVNYMIVEVGEVKEGLEPGDNECRQFREVRISERREKQYGMAEEESESRRRIDS